MVFEHANNGSIVFYCSASYGLAHALAVEHCALARDIIRLLLHSVHPSFSFPLLYPLVVFVLSILQYIIMSEHDEGDNNAFRDMILLSDQEYYTSGSSDDESFIAGEDDFDPFTSLTPSSPTTTNNGTHPVTQQMTALTLRSNSGDGSSSSFSDYEITASDLELGDGRDWQGIPWDSSNLTRAQFREVRYREYCQQNESSVPTGRSPSFHSKKRYFEFANMDRFESVSIHHHQLRHLLVSDGYQGVYYPRGNRIKHWQDSGRLATVRLNLCNLNQPFSKVTSLAFLPCWDLMAVGGMMGELVLHRKATPWDGPEDDLMKEWYSVAPRDIGIITGLEFDPMDEKMLMMSCNDKAVRFLDVSQGKVSKSLDVQFPCNKAAKNAHKNCVAVATDDPRISLWDARTSKRSEYINGHTCENFALCWLGEHKLASGGGHDLIVHDIRNLCEPLFKCSSKMASISSIATNCDCSLMAVMESDDFIQVYDVNSLPQRGEPQVVDFFGEASGVVFGESGDSELLHFGVSGNEYSGIMRLERKVII